MCHLMHIFALRKQTVFFEISGGFLLQCEADLTEPGLEKNSASRGSVGLASQ